MNSFVMHRYICIYILCVRVRCFGVAVYVCVFVVRALFNTHPSSDAAAEAAAAKTGAAATAVAAVQNPRTN